MSDFYYGLADQKPMNEKSGYVALPTSEDALPQPVAQPPQRSTLKKWAFRVVGATAAYFVVSHVASCGARHYYKYTHRAASHSGFVHVFGHDEHPHHPEHEVHPECQLWVPEDQDDLHNIPSHWASAADSVRFDDDKTTFNFEFPIDNKFMGIGSRGPFSGKIDFVRSDDISDKVLVDVSLPKGKLVENPHKPHDDDLKRSVDGDDHPKHPPFVRVCKWIHNESGRTVGVTLGNGPRPRGGPHHPHGPPPHHDPHHDPHHHDDDHPHRNLPRHLTPPRPHHGCPHGGPRPDTIAADIVVTIPSGEVNLAHFKTRLFGLEHNLFDLKGVSFDRAEFASANASVHVKGLRVHHGVIAAAGGDVEGTFTADRELTIATAHGSIDAMVNAVNFLNPPTKVTIANTGAPIKAHITLDTPEDDNEDYQPSFAINAAAKDSPIELTVARQPIGALVQVSAVNRNDRLQVTMPPAYEGPFSVISPKGAAEVIKNEEAEDPEERGRERVVNVRNRFGIITGDVKWADTDDSKSKKPRTWPGNRKNGVSLVNGNGDTVLYV